MPECNLQRLAVGIRCGASGCRKRIRLVARLLELLRRSEHVCHESDNRKQKSRREVHFDKGKKTRLRKVRNQKKEGRNCMKSKGKKTEAP
jgi:hypothetical protein